MQTNNNPTPEGVTEPASSSSAQARGAFDLRSSVTKTPQNMKYWAIAGVVFVVLIAGLVALWAVAFNVMNEGSTDIDESKVQADTMLRSNEGNDDAMKIAKEAKARRMAEEEALKRKQEQQAKPAPAPESKPAPPPKSTGQAPAPSGQGNSSAPAEKTPLQRKLGGGVYVKPTSVAGSSYGQSATGARQSSVGSSEADAGVLDGGGGSGSSPYRGSLSSLSGTGFKPSKAVLAPDGKYLLRHNTYGRCALYTEIITDQPGLVECRLTEPLYSADGSTVIAEAGAPLSGEQKVEVRPGQTRVFTTWTELETSSGVAGVPGIRARLDSLGAGQMGASGTKAWIDNHYLERYGGAVALSAFQDVLSAASNSTQESGSGYTVNNSEQNVENMASKALDANININPTGYLLPGTILTVIIARDIDFSSVLENR
ncbi:type IV secretion system protein VirB10 [Pseudomonas sp. BIGb0381]|uniref:TrbI/VirB10 family protein n=1 Tax=Pseudomonas sp. BIGb0381 TaxID=2940608 RepID=UPI002168D71C|nr:TrbI/VirB10 family protein [Pseudomonas sp. BIGb0381]MCS4315588.1 type IV secretion system protein VirB10 [Pseudomonas sp. BIGb0381]